MKIKKFLFNFILMFMAISLALNVVVFAKQDNSEEKNIEESKVEVQSIEKIEDFKGVRTFSIYSDLSNLKNYIQGGRSSLEYIIRMNNKEWLSLDISSDDYDIKLDFSFEFSSYEDYIEKIEYLLTYNPSIINEDETYIEGFATKELANFLRDDLQANELYLSDTDDIELFASGDSKISFSNSKEYNSNGERIKHQENEDISLLLKSLKIDTSYDKEQNNFTRKIEFEIETESNSLLNSMKKSFMNRCKKQKIEYENPEAKKILVEFTRNSERELSLATMMLLNIGESIGTKEQYSNGNKLDVIFSEYLDIEDILISDNPEFSYTFDLSNFEKAKLVDGYNENEGFTYENNILSVNIPKSSIKFSYQKNFEFDKLEVITDFSKDWNITRTISMKTRTIIAKNIHEEIKNSLVNAIPDGVTLNIYDKGAYRYYDIVFKGNINKINSITSKTIDGESKLKVSQMLLPFMPSKVEDNLTIGQICNYVENYKSIEYKYIFSKDTKLPYEKELNTIKNEDGTVTVIEKNNNISITYKHFDKILFAKSLILVIIVIIVILIIKNKIKKIRKTINDKKEKKKIDKENSKTLEKSNKKGEKSGK